MIEFWIVFDFTVFKKIEFLTKEACRLKFLCWQFENHCCFRFRWKIQIGGPGRPGEFKSKYLHGVYVKKVEKHGRNNYTVVNYCVDIFITKLRVPWRKNFFLYRYDERHPLTTYSIFFLYLTNEITDRPGRIINPPLLKCLLRLIKRDIECISPLFVLNESRFITELQAAREWRCHSDWAKARPNVLKKKF